jgi:hypothetical protein
LSGLSGRQTEVDPREIRQLSAEVDGEQPSRKPDVHQLIGRRRPDPGKDEELERYALVFDHLRAGVLAPDEAVSLIAGMAKEL